MPFALSGASVRPGVATRRLIPGMAAIRDTNPPRAVVLILPGVASRRLSARDASIRDASRASICPSQVTSTRTHPHIVHDQGDAGGGESQSGRMPYPPRPLPPSLGPQFSSARAIAEGVTRRRLRARDLEAPFHGVRRLVTPRHADDLGLDQPPLALDRQIRAAVLRDALTFGQVMPSGSFFAGRTAAILHGLPADPLEDLEVAVMAPRRAPRGQGVRGRKIAEQFVTVSILRGLPVASPVSAWAMLGRDLTERELVILADAIVRVPRDDSGRRHPELSLATRDQLQAAVDASTGRPGSRRLRAALPRVREGSASPLETDFRLDAEAGGLPRPDLDIEIRNHNGALIGISEIVYPRLRVVVEIEGDHHRTSRQQWNRDIDKYRAYAAEGWEVVRLTSAHIRGRRPSAVQIVREILLRRGWTP